uniref:THAP domain-containing protein 3 n=1 Tax=Oncorhynchus gorbuscha TaxID=8017 RepID=UPI001EAEB6A8|nr:THAP domain-containing protein 3 [Oncorhynchus gorbuscha]
MPKSCYAYNCTNRYSKHTDITFHRFPFSKPTVFRQWLDNICRDYFYPKKHMVICSIHFTTDCFSGLGNHKNLLWNAVPTLYIPTTKLKESQEKGSKCFQSVSVCPKKRWKHRMAWTQKRNYYPNLQRATRNMSSSPISYSLSGPCAVKAQLFKTLDTNKWLNRLQMKSQLINKMRFKLKAAHTELSSLRSWTNLSRAAGKVSIWLSVQRIAVNDISRPIN